MRALILTAGAAGISGIASAATVGLDNTTVSVEVQGQVTESDERVSVTFLDRAVVGDETEFPSLASLEIDSNPIGPNFSVVDAAVDIGNDFIEVTYDNAGSGSFTDLFFNGYLFSFESDAAASFREATIDPVTTVGLTNEDLSFAGSDLFVNAAGRSFNPSSVIRISALFGTGEPENPDPPTVNDNGIEESHVIPIPASLPLFLSAGVALTLFGRRRK